MRGETWAPGTTLTRREIETLAALARHGVIKEAADELGISVQTAKNYLTRAYSRLGVTTRIEAYSALGWLHVPDDLNESGIPPA